MTMIEAADAPTATRSRVVDCHTHVLPRGYVADLARLAESEPLLAPARRAATPEGMSRLPATCARYLLDDLATRLDLMSAAGVDRQILSPGSALAYPDGAGHRGELVASWNDGVHEEIMASARPSAFGVFAAVPLPDVPAAIRETHRVAGRETTAGFGVTAHVLGEPFDGERWHPLFAVWDEMRATVFVHPDRFRARGLMPAHTEVDAGTQFDDTLVTLRLAGAGIADRFPHIRWLVAHLGGAFPFLLERLDEHWERDRRWRPEPRRPSRSLRNVWFDTAGHGGAAVRFAVEALGASRFVFGSDFPMLGAEHYRDAARRVRSAAGGADDGRRVLCGNVADLLGRTTTRNAAVVDAEAGT